MSKAKLSATEWELVRNAPYWVNQALAEADGRQSLLARRRENKAFEKAIEEYKSSNALIRDIIADDGDAAKEVGKGSQADAEAALSRIAAVVQEKLGDDDLKELSAFLKQVGHAVAGATKEGGRGNSGVVSEKESAALARIESAMKVSSAYTTAHTAQSTAKPTATTKPAPKPAAKPSASAKPAPATRDDDKKKEQEKKLAEARERQEKARAEADAKAEARKDAEAKERLEKARKEAEERQAAAAAEREATQREREAAAEREAQAQAEAEAVGASPYREFIAEHTVQPGDNLSFISQRYYGTQANFRIIYEANRDVIGENMNLIKPGQKLRIPKL